MLLNRCEFGKDDYSFNIVNLPHDEESIDEEEIDISVQELNDNTSKTDQPTLFD